MPKTQLTKNIILISSMLVLICMAFVHPAAAQQDEVLIGALVPETGSLGFFGVHAKFAIEQALDDFNKYLFDKNADWRLAVDIRDTASDTDTSLEQTESLITGNVEFISGPARSSSLDAIKTYLAANPTIDLSLVSYSSTAPDLALPDFIYRLVPSDAKHGPVIANLMYGEGKTVVIPVYVDDPFGRGLSASTADTFTKLGGTAIYQTLSDSDATYKKGSGILTYKDCTDKNADEPGNGNITCDGQFTDIASDLNDIVLEQIKQNGADRIFVLYVGFDSPTFIAQSAKYPALRLVQWVGSDADVQKPELVDNKNIADFLSDTNFRTYTFEFESDTARFTSLQTALNKQYPGMTPLKYVYSAYDSIWAIGLAIESAGGSGYTYDDVDLVTAINNNDDGTLGDVTLDEYGDLDTADFGVYGIEDGAWVRIATYYADGSLIVTYDDPTNIINVGVLLSLDNILFYDDDFAVTMALANQDFNNDHDNNSISLHTINTSNGPFSALNTLYYGTYDDYYYSSLKVEIEKAINGYTTTNGFSIDGTYTQDPYPFVVDSKGVIIAHGTVPSLVGTSADLVITNPDMDFSFVYDRFTSSTAPSEMWWQYEFENAATDSSGIKRSLIVYHAESGYLVGAGYNPPIGDDGHKPYLEAVINEAITAYDSISIGDKFAGIDGTFDPATDLFYPFVIDSVTYDIVAHAQDSSRIGVNSLSIGIPDRHPEVILSDLQSGGTWVSYTLEDPATGLEQTRRAWFVLHDDLVFASAYIIDEKTKYFLGLTVSQSIIYAKPFFDSTDSILISPTSTATSLAVEDNIYRLQPTLEHEKRALIDLLSRDEKTSLIIVYFNDEWGRNYADSFRPTVPDANIHVITADTVYTDMVTSLESSVSTISDEGVNSKNIAVLLIGGSSNFINLSIDINPNSILRDIEWYTPGGIVSDSTIPNHLTASEFANQVNFTSIAFGIEPNIISLELKDNLSSLGVNYHSYHDPVYDTVSLLGNLGIEYAEDYTSIKDHLDDTENSYNGALGQYVLDSVGDLHTPNSYHTFSIVTNDNQDPIWERTDKTIIDIGAIVPESGRQDNAGAHRKYATIVAVSDFNGYLIENNADWRLSVDIMDSQVNPTASLAAARTLYENGISFISGPSISSGLTKIKTDLIESEGANLSLVSCCSTAPSLKEIDNIFRLAASDDKHGIVIANLIYNDGKRQLIPLHIDDTFGLGLTTSTGNEFKSLGGTVDTAPRTYASCTDKSDITCDGQLQGLVRELADAVSTSPYDADEIAILYVGFELDLIVQESLKYPVLRTVSWVGSDAQVLSSSLVDDPEIKDFLVDVNFTSRIFDADYTSTKYVDLRNNLEYKFPGETPSVYAYSSYDTIWAIGLARDVAGLNASFEEVASSIPAAVQKNQGALGNVFLDEYGDLAVANYAIYGIFQTGWERVGTYFADRGFEATDTSCNISLEYPSLNFGKANAYSLLTGVKQQTITNTGFKTIESLNVFPSNSDGLLTHSPLIEVQMDNTFELLNAKKELTTNLAPGDDITVSFRMNFKHAESLLSPGSLVSQNIAYQTICTDD